MGRGGTMKKTLKLTASRSATLETYCHVTVDAPDGMPDGQLAEEVAGMLQAEDCDVQGLEWIATDEYDYDDITLDSIEAEVVEVVGNEQVTDLAIEAADLDPEGLYARERQLKAKAQGLGLRVEPSEFGGWWLCTQPGEDGWYAKIGYKTLDNLERELREEEARASV